MSDGPMPQFDETPYAPEVERDPRRTRVSAPPPSDPKDTKTNFTLHLPGGPDSSEMAQLEWSLTAASEPTGEKIEQFQIAGQIACGGMGIIYRGWDSQIGRSIAVKVLHEAHRGRPDLKQRFVDEARITGRLQHPGIAPIFHMGNLPDERPYFVMRLLHGHTLAELLAQRSHRHEDLPKHIKIFEQVCQAMAYAHVEGVIHLDLKPSNIMVAAFGVVKVMDWGLARALPRGKALFNECSSSSDTCEVDWSTRRGSVFGTPSYMPAEQARGEVDKLDERADVFGLGAILCEILTGAPPYTGKDAKHVYKRSASADLSEAFDRLQHCGADAELIMLAQDCLAPERENRPQDALQVAIRLTSYLEASIRRAEKDYVRFFELSPDLFCIADFDGRFRRVNVNFSRVLGYSVEEFVFKPFLDLVHPEDRERTKAETARLAQGLPVVHFLNRLRDVNGGYRWFDWTAKPITEEQLIFAVARDVTDWVEERGKPSSAGPASPVCE
jgi:PAS domain S-box-containing protein